MPLLAEGFSSVPKNGCCTTALCFVIIARPLYSLHGAFQVKATVAKAFLRRLNDPANEYSRLEVLQDDSKFLLFESTLFASDPEASRTALTNMDSQYVILEQIWQEIDRLQTEGFAGSERG